MSTLIEAISNAVIPSPKPCVNISGGIDSTIILHHLNEKSQEQISTYTVGFPGQESEFIYAQKVADHYGTRHKEILIEKLLPRYREILVHFTQPRYNLWPYWIAEQQKRDGRLNCYIGEGGDEHFGGYWYKPQASYVENWSNFFHYVYPTYKTIYDAFGVKLHVPMHPSNLDWHITTPYYDQQQHKEYLKHVYKGIIPNFVIDRRKFNNHKDYWVMWQTELKPLFPLVSPRCEDDIRELWNIYAAHEWLKAKTVADNYFKALPAYEALHQ